MPRDAATIMGRKGLESQVNSRQYLPYSDSRATSMRRVLRVGRCLACVAGGHFEPKADIRRKAGIGGTGIASRGSCRGRAL